jgi:uncharacterized DUF497 family protein
MRIVWDESKRLINIARHEMDFVDLDEAFFRPRSFALQKMAV